MLAIRAQNAQTAGFALLIQPLHNLASVGMDGHVQIAKMGTFAFQAPLLHQMA